MEKRLTKLERSWILYDVGNSAFILLVSTIIPIYFNYLSEQAGLSDVRYLAYWGYASSLVTVVVAFIGPVLGAAADYKNYRKPLFMTFLFLGALGCFLLGCGTHWLTFLLIFMIAKIGYSASLIFYDAMLVDITKQERLDEISSQGFAWGYIGSCIPFLVSLGIVLGREMIGFTMRRAMVASFAIVAAWWMVLTLPLLKNYKQINFVKRKSNVIAESFGRLWETLKGMKGDRKVFLFLVAYFFYIDGVYTIIDMATAYGTALGLDTAGLLLALLLTQVVAFPSAIVFGRLTRRYATGRLILICIFAYTGMAVFALFMRSQPQFWMLGIFVGMFQGGIQALSRSHFAKLIPAEEAGEYFGILDIFGKGASFLGTTLVGIVSQITGSINKGIGVLVLVFGLGMVFFVMSERKA